MKINGIVRKVLRIYKKLSLITQLLLMIIYVNINWFLQSQLMSISDKEKFDTLYWILVTYNIVGFILIAFVIYYWYKVLIEYWKENLSNDKK